ncbi:MAG: GNAT family N-acetyltransferase [Candidatus Microgenomates bacterium]|jgi:ribosomal protein S18 acetylase RimI-like enzyme
MDIKIQAATPKDWQIIQKLNNQVFIADKDHDDDLDMDWPFSETGIKYYKDLSDGKYGKCFIAFLGSEPVGYVALADKDFNGYRKSKYIEIENIGVDPKYRSQGIGHLLIEESGKWAKENGATKLFVSAYWQNKMAINFYKKNGFYETGVELDKKL